MPRFEFDSPFCGNPDCPLHVRSGMPGVCGSGNWAVFPDGRIVGRHGYYGIILCDGCRRNWQAVQAFLNDGVAIGGQCSAIA
jgi:hypothetical protein